MNVEFSLLIIFLFLLIYFLAFIYGRLIFKVPFVSRFIFLGLLIHEIAHFLACKLTLAKVLEFKVTTTHGFVRHQKSKLPIVGEFLISFAPLLLGLFLLTVLILFLMGFNLAEVKELLVFLRKENFNELIYFLFSSIKKIDFISIKFGVSLILILNIIATFIPSGQDIRNIFLPLSIYVICSFFLIGLNQLNYFIFIILFLACLWLILGVLLLSVVWGILKVLSKFPMIIRRQ